MVKVTMKKIKWVLDDQSGDHDYADHVCFIAYSFSDRQAKRNDLYVKLY